MGFEVPHSAQRALTAAPAVKLHDFGRLLMEFVSYFCAGISGHLRGTAGISALKCGLLGGYLRVSRTIKAHPALALAARIAGIAGIVARKCGYSRVWVARATSLKQMP